MRAVRYSHAVRKMILVAVAAACGVACSTLLGVDDLPGIMGVDGGDAHMDSLRDAGPGRLDPSFGDHGIATITMNTSLSDAELIVEGDDIRIFALTEEDALLLIRCSKDGQCDTSHPTTIWTGQEIAGYAMKDPTGGDLLVHMSVAAPNFHTIRQLVRLVRDGGVEVLQREELDYSSSVSDHGVAAGPSRIVMLQPADLGVDGGEIQLRGLLPDGGVDRQFGTNGNAASPNFGQTPLLNGVTMEPDGAIFVLLGNLPSNFATWLRFRADGGLDTTFGSDGGIGETSALSSGKAFLADDAGYVIGGSRNDARGVLAYVTREGRLDPSRWDQGIFRFPSLSASDDPYVISVEALGRGPNGTIVVLGTAHQLRGPSITVLARVGPSGLDRSFGDNGLVSLGTNATEGPDSLAMQSDGKALVVWADGDGALRLARYFVE